MAGAPSVEVLDWLSSPENPPVRYLTARDLQRPTPSAEELTALHGDILGWSPLATILERQRDDGSFPGNTKTQTAQATFTALAVMNLCALSVADQPVSHAVEYLSRKHMTGGALSYTGGSAGVLPCYVGVVCVALIGLGAIESEMVQSSISWLTKHQRFDHKSMKAGGDERWPYRTPANFGCWDGVSCYHGVAGTFAALAAIPARSRSEVVELRIQEALQYLRLHHLYKRSKGDRPLFRHLTQFFLVGDYRLDLLDMLDAIAAADPTLLGEDWVRAAFDDMETLCDGERVTLVKNYGRKLIDPIPLEPLGAASRFLTYQWLNTRRVFGEYGVL